MRSIILGCLLVVGAGSSHPAAAQKVNNIILVHGAFADGSGWEGVYNILTKKGYNVTIVQNPLTSLEDDVAATNLALDKQDGPVILVGHSWAGTVITQAGVSSKVLRLVYIEGFQPEVGETTAQLASSEPADKDNGLLPPDDKGIIYYSKEKYHAGFCADLPAEKANFMYASQGTIAVKCFTAPVTEAAWRTKPTYAIVATDDKSINPVILRRMYKRAGSIVTEIKASHVVYVSQPEKVAKVIEAAALGITK